MPSGHCASAFLAAEPAWRLVDVFGLVPEHGEAALTYARADARMPFISNNPELWDATAADLRAGP
ncbi:MAG: hypothetical protein R3D29_05970 [Nitratireductor sp.]